jgi:hypothetical protein
MRSLVIFVLLANLADAGLTLWWIDQGHATEWNPIMAHVVERPVIFTATKVVLVSLGLWLLWLRRDHWLAKRGVLVVSLAFCGVMAMHLAGLMYL